MPRFHRLFWPGLLPLLVLIIALPGCLNAPTKAAQTPEQKAYAVYGTFVVLEEQAAVITQNANVPASVKRALAAADNVAKPSADALAVALKTYVATKANGSTSTLNAALAALATASDQAQTDMSGLSTLVKENAK